jgi:glucuronosyltransferase
MKYQRNFENLFLYWNVGGDSAAWHLKSEKVIDFIKNDQTKFDLLITEQFFQESWLMFMYKFKDTPMITISSYGYSDFMDRAMGALTPYSFVPHKLLMHYGDDMNFWQRCENFILSMYDVVLRKVYYMPKLNRAAREAFSSIATSDSPLPTIEELENRISLMLVNNHWGYTRPRPLMPNMINIGGFHIKPPKPLPSDIQSFLDGAEHGAIYFCIGSYMQSSTMPKEKIQAILKVFGKLKQRVLWKYESDDLEKQPRNLMIKKWLPQSDILAHPKIVLFIAHGGIFGTQEGSFRGVPMLFVPFFGDQNRNSMNTVAQGFGLKLNFKEVTEESLSWHIEEMLTNQKYSKRAKEVAKILNDNPIKPMDEAMYWIEYVIRHKGAKHLQSAATQLSWFQYLSLDIIGFFIAIFVGSSLIFLKFITSFKRVFSKFPTNDSIKLKKKKQ